MNLEFANTILSRIGPVEPPGCCGTFLSHPHPSFRNSRSVEIGFVIEHRFAFHYWIKCKQKLKNDRRTGDRVPDEDFRPPDLITWDWHDDFGCPDDYIESELEKLNQQDEEEVAFFCWAGLGSLNDGHIAPAVWLNAIGNVYILQKQRDDDECDNESCDYIDRYNNKHEVRYFRSAKKLAHAFDRTNSQSGVIWDVDMDFFTEEEEVDDQPYTPLMSKRSIRGLLSPKHHWMQQILRNVEAITIALEPIYTGGMSRSLEIYRTWESVLFESPVFDERCQWRDDLFR